MKWLSKLTPVLMTLSVSLCAMAAEPQVLRMATTTSTENSGLLPVLNEPFQKQHNARIDVIAVGSGKALQLGANGDVDIVFVHDPDAEQKFVAAGNGVDRAAVMHNDFILVGPKDDPAGIKGAKSAGDAMAKIASARAGFVSRGDESGTHVKEKTLWSEAGIRPEGLWYLSAGQGMGAVLRMADDLWAYTLTDRGTYAAMQEKLSLALLYEGATTLFNPYHLIAVNPAKHRHVNYQLAKAYIDYVTGQQGQSVIAGYKVKGQQLFFPDAEAAKL